MSKHYLRYKILSLMLRGLTYLKKGIFLALGLLWRALVSINELYKRTLGFYLYKGLFYLGKFFKKYFLLQRYGRLELLSQRGALQLFLLILVLAIGFPHTKLYTQSSDQIPGRKTFLYRMVGPSEFDFELEEIVVNTQHTELIEDAGLWKQGALLVDNTQPEARSRSEVSELSGISAGGSALTKPIISPGADVKSLAADAAIESRHDIVFYEVKPGDVVGNIAKRFNVSVETILWANNLTARSLIRPGNKLKILPVDGVAHTVTSGETVSAIAKKYDAEMSKIVSFNRLQEGGADIVVGEELIVPGGSIKIVQAPVTRSRESSPLRSVVAPPPSVTAPAGSGYLWPTTASYITQYYGWRHTGLDIAGKIGEAIYAARAGTVTTASCGWNGGYGCYIIIDHGGGVQSLYAHNSQLYVGVGQSVSQGQTIALMGSTGRSTGPHVHFEVRVDGRRMNPLGYIRR